MDAYLYEINHLAELGESKKKLAMEALESGKIIYLPHHAPKVREEEKNLFSESILHKKSKNISYDYTRQRLAGQATMTLSQTLQQFMHRYAEFSKQLVNRLLPHYDSTMRWGRTSYRPAEIQGRVTSKLKDDTRLHVDSFPATPVNGERILRVFCNLNPLGVPRVWHVGEPFEQVFKQFAPRVPTYHKLMAHLLNTFQATKTLRTPYDHTMLNIHNMMKLDEPYQAQVIKQRIDFPSYSTWIVFTDHVSHAALSGQFLLEQTFYLPVHGMQNQEHAPMTYFQKHFGILASPSA